MVAEVSWPHVQAQLTNGAVAVLPVGAACKAHGRHLPMNSDYLQAEWLARQLVQRAFVAVWPVVSYGHYPAFVAYAGSCSLSADTFQSIVSAIIGDIQRAGARRIVILNTGLSTVAPLEAAAAQGASPGDIRLAHVYQGRHFRARAALLEEQPRGGHADELETSIMLAIAPGSVDMSRAVDWSKREVKGCFNPTDPASVGYAPDGVYGDATRATAAKGTQLLAGMLQDISDLIPGGGK